MSPYLSFYNVENCHTFMVRMVILDQYYQQNNPFSAIVQYSIGYALVQHSW